MTAHALAAPAMARPARYRSLQTLLLIAVFGSLICSVWLLPSRLERVMAAVERGDQPLLDRELGQAAESPADPGETRGLADVALTLGAPGLAASILQQSLAQHPDSVLAVRLLLEVQRQRHRMTDVARLDEQIFARTGDPAALREAADIYASQHRAAERVDALRRLDTADQASAAEMAELAHRLSDQGASREALSLLLGWLDRQTGPLPSDVVALAAGMSAAAPDAAEAAERLGGLVGRARADGPLHVLVQTFAERGSPRLALIAAHAVGDEMLARPDVALLVSQLEALQGDFASARRRLDDLDRAGLLPPAGLPMLAELSLQTGDVVRAVALTNKFSAEQMPEGWPRRLVDAADAAGQSSALAKLDVGSFADTSSASAAVVALAQGDRTTAATLAQRALSADTTLEDVGPAFGKVVHAAGLERLAVTTLVGAAEAGRIGENGISLLLEFASSSPADAPTLLQALRTLREKSPTAAAAWASAAARQGKSAEVALWLQARGSQLPATALLDLMVQANERHDPAVAHAAGSALAGRTELPDGWTSNEVDFTARATDKLSPGRLREGLALIAASPTTAGRDRIVASLVSAPDFSKIAQDWGATSGFGPTLGADATAWLGAPVSGSERIEAAVARLTLLSTVAPQKALAPLAQSWNVDPPHLLPVYAAALLRTGRAVEATRILTAELRGISPKQQDGMLFATLAQVPGGAALPLLKLGAQSGREDWISAFQDALARAGMLDELRADLRGRAAVAGLSGVQLRAIASRLVDLNDRPGAIAILKSAVSGLRPGDPDVEQLLYLWGPRADPAAIAWVRDRAGAAAEADLPKWLDHLAYLGAPRAVIDLIERQPAMLSRSAAAARAYGSALIAARAQTKMDLQPVIGAASSPDVLSALGQLALDNGQARAAWLAAHTALATAPNDPATLLLAAQSAASLRRSDDAASLYLRLLERGPQRVEVTVDAGDALINAKRNELGRKVLTEALGRLAQTPATLSEARLRARVLLLLRRNDEALSLLTQWLARSPGHLGLQADLLQAQLNEKQATR